MQPFISVHAKFLIGASLLLTQVPYCNPFAALRSSTCYLIMSKFLCCVHPHLVLRIMSMFAIPIAFAHNVDQVALTN
jgi:hypothetical protein